MKERLKEQSAEEQLKNLIRNLRRGGENNDARGVLFVMNLRRSDLASAITALVQSRWIAVEDLEIDGDLIGQFEVFIEMLMPGNKKIIKPALSIFA